MNEPFRIRQATVADAPAIAEVHLRSWQWAYRDLVPALYLEHLAATLRDRQQRLRARIAQQQPEERFWLAERAGHIIGFTITGPSRDADASARTGEIQAIYLDPEVIGTGIGRALFAHAVDDLRSRGYGPLTLWVLEGNSRAQRFYEAAGWHPDGAAKIEQRPGAMLKEVRFRLLGPG